MIELIAKMCALPVTVLALIGIHGWLSGDTASQETVKDFTIRPLEHIGLRKLPSKNPGGFRFKSTSEALGALKSGQITRQEFDEAMQDMQIP